jgi:hypothetical protein
VIPFALLTAAVISLVVAVILLRSVGAPYRVGRTLAAARVVDIDQARRIAAGPAAYVRVEGRISSDEEFPDENDRPLVYRRKRVQIDTDVLNRRRDRWRTISDEREAVPFGIETRGASIAVDVDAIASGLIAIPRESTGVWSDLPADVVAGIEARPPDTAAKLVIEQLSAVEYATVCGTPVLISGQPTITAGLGRPLIVTTLDQASAMRLLAAGQRPRVVGAAALIVIAVGLLVVGGVALAAGL